MDRPMQFPQRTFKNWENSIIMYHGTSIENARHIYKYGFVKSSEGCLGPGFYFAERDKAERFANNNSRHQGKKGGLLKCEISYDKAKY